MRKRYRRYRIRKKQFYLTKKQQKKLFLIPFFVVLTVILTCNLCAPKDDLPDYIRSNSYFAWPTPSLHTVTSGFTPKRFHPVFCKVRPHNGIDISGPDAMGSPVIAIADGIITLVQQDGGERGLNIRIQHNIGRDVWVSRYQHLSSVNVSIGDKVSQGTVIGAVGNSGVSTGAHLHIEITYNGVLIDPLILLER